MPPLITDERRFRFLHEAFSPLAGMATFLPAGLRAVSLRRISLTNRVSRIWPVFVRQQFDVICTHFSELSALSR